MNDETPTVKKPIRIGSITINADNPAEAILAILRYHKSIRLQSKVTLKRNQIITRRYERGQTDNVKRRG